MYFIYFFTFFQDFSTTPLFFYTMKFKVFQCCFLDSINFHHIDKSSWKISKCNFGSLYVHTLSKQSRLVLEAGQAFTIMCESSCIITEQFSRTNTDYCIPAMKPQHMQCCKPPGISHSCENTGVFVSSVMPVLCNLYLSVRVWTLSGD